MTATNGFLRDCILEILKIDRHAVAWKASYMHEKHVN